MAPQSVFWLSGALSTTDALTPQKRRLAAAVATYIMPDRLLEFVESLFGLPIKGTSALLDEGGSLREFI